MKILTIGHAALDLFFTLPEARVRELLGAPDELCLPYGDKLMIHEMEISLGGNAPNVGVGLAKLGLEAGLYAQVGEDFLGDLTMQMLEEAGLDLSQVTRAGGTDISAILTFEGERTILAYHPHRNWNFELPTDFTPDAIYLSSLGLQRFQGFHQDLIVWLEDQRKMGAQPSLFYNPGKDETLAGVDNLPILQHTHVLYVNKQEAGGLLGQKIDENTDTEVIKQLAINLQQSGPDVVIITDGINGSYGYDGNNFYHQAIFPCEVIERTGAGDAFSSGSMAAFLSGKDLPEALRWGTIQAHSVIQQVGATQGLLTLDQLHEILERHD